MLQGSFSRAAASLARRAAGAASIASLKLASATPSGGLANSAAAEIWNVSTPFKNVNITNTLMFVSAKTVCKYSS